MKDDLKFFSNLVSEIIEEEKKNPIVKPLSPTEISKDIDLKLPENSTKQDLFESSLRNIVMATPRTSSRLFFNQLFGGRNSKAILGDLLSVILNNGMHVYKVNGIQILIEREIINTLSNMINYPSLNSSGIFTPGGSMSNFMALLMARDNYDNNIKTKGVTKNMIVYTSDQSHYSMVKNIRFAGIGEENLRKISSDERGCIDIIELEKTIIKDIHDGNHPFFIKGTAGTTVLGVFDPFRDIAQICKKYNIWFHIDGALGGSTLFSDTYKKLLGGVELSDSFSINAHKMIGTPISCSMIIVKDKKNLYQSFNSEADYLYQGDDNELNPGMISLQCARKNDALKFWTLWKSVGRKGLGNIVEKEFSLAQHARDYINNNPDYTLYSFDDSINVCFNYKNYNAEDVCKILYKESELLVGHGSFKGNSFIRLITVQHENSNKDIMNFFKIIERVTHEKM